jgi:DNA-directed RNA polymerase subunit RPC12/RpoP
MPAWTLYSCGNCKKRISVETQDTFYLIGVPYLRCERCGTINDRSTRRNEWDLMLWPMRAGVYATAAFLGAAFGGGGASALLAFSAEKFHFSNRVTGTLWGTVLIVGGAIGAMLYWQWGVKAAIRESRERLSDATYIETLLSLGLASGSLEQGLQGASHRTVSSGAILGYLALAAVIMFAAVRIVQIWSQ